MATTPSLPTELILLIFSTLQPHDQISLLRAVPALATLLTPQHTTTTDADGRTLLHLLARDGHAALLSLLLPGLVNTLNEMPRDNDKRTPLSYAAENGHDAVVSLLLEPEYID